MNNEDGFIRQLRRAASHFFSYQLLQQHGSNSFLAQRQQHSEAEALHMIHNADLQSAGTMFVRTTQKTQVSRSENVVNVDAHTKDKV